MKQKISIAISPCPNDIFLFGPLLREKIESHFTYDISIFPLDKLNFLATQKNKDILKLSFPTIFSAMEDYILLPYGSAISETEGPIVVSNFSGNINKSCFKIAIPGLGTTSDLLVRLLYPHLQRFYCSYKDIVCNVERKKVDLGIIVHESRSCYDKYNLTFVNNMGKSWYKKFSCPLPLGGVVARRSLDFVSLKKICDDLINSLFFSEKNPAFIFSEMEKYSQEKSKNLLFNHVHSFIKNNNYGICEHEKYGIKKMYSLYCREFKKEKSNINNLFLKI